MKHVPLLATLVAALCGALLPAATAAARTEPYIVLLEKSSAPAARAATSDITDDVDVTPTQRYDDAVHGFAARLDAHDVAEVRDDPRVRAVVPDRPVRMTDVVPLQVGDNSPLGVRRVGAATANTTRQASTANVAVIDTGVDLGHPDINAVAGANCNGTGAPIDGNGHGTHVAGIIGAKNQGSGAVGVVPGTKIFAVRVLNAAGSGYTSNIVCGIDWVTSTRTDSDPNNDIMVANMSLGGGLAPYGNCGRGVNDIEHLAIIVCGIDWVTSTRTDSDPNNDIMVANMSLGGGLAPYGNCGRGVNDIEHLAICNSVAAGVTYVVAAGNSATDLQNFAPANYGEVLTVTAMGDSDGLPGGRGGALSCIANGDDTPAGYSNYATRAADIAHTIAAPGSCIRSTYPGNRYATMSGTSMASPHVAGLVALCLGENGAHGPCWGQPPATVIAMMLSGASSAAAAAPENVFSGAPSRPISGRYYGDLAGTTFPSATGGMPVNTAVPAISGTASTVATLTATAGSWTGEGNRYATQWLRCTSASALGTCSAIAGATAPTYQPGSADVGRYLRARVTATNGQGAGMVSSAATAAVVAPAPPVATVAPSVIGDPLVGRTLTSRNGTWTGAAPMSFALGWARCTSPTSVASCTPIAGAAGTTYAVTVADVARYLRATYAATNVRSTVVAWSPATRVVTTPPVGPTAPPANTALPTITGTGRVGLVATANTGSWSSSPTVVTIQWKRCLTTETASCVDISGAVGATYTMATADRGRRLRIAVTARNVKGSVTALSTPLGPIA